MYLANKLPSRTRIRKTTQYLMSYNSEEFNLFSGLDQNQRQHAAIKILWLFLVCSSAATCIFQISNRIEYYLSEPVIVDAFVEELSEGDLPSLTLRIVRTDEYKELTDGKDARFSETVKYLNVSAETLWQAINSSKLIEDTYFSKQGKRLSNASRKTEINVMGIVTNIFNDQPLPLDERSLKLHVVFKRGVYVNQYMQVKGSLLTDATTERYTFVKGKIQSLGVSMERFTFKNRGSYKCKETEDYEKCIYACQQDFFDVVLECRLPYMTSDYALTLPKCWLSESVGEIIMDIYYAYVKLEFECAQCHEGCDVTLLHFTNDFSAVEGNELQINLQSNTVRKMSEKFAYDFISLLCDVGGNLGLFLGMSCLSMVEIVAGCSIWLSHKNQLAKLSKDVLFGKILKIFKEQRHQKKVNNAAMGKTTSEHYFIKLIIVIATCLCIYQAYDRIAYYFSHPTNTEIELVQGKELISLVSCIGSEKIYNAIENYAKDRNIPVFRVDLLDLLDESSKFTDVNDLWLASSDLKEHTVPQAYRYVFIPEYKEIPIVTPFGNCTTVNEGVYINHFGENGTCTYKNFFLPIDRTIDYKQYIQFACGHVNAVTYKTQVLERINTPSKPCVTAEEADDCEQNCYRNKLFSKGITCSLPYMDFVDLPPCKTTESAKRSKVAYVEAFMDTDAMMHCSCKRRCSETLLLPVLSEVAVSPRPWLNLVEYKQKGKHMEVIKQSASFPIEKLLCDIGSSLGTILGVSVLSLFQVLQSSIDAVKFLKALIVKCKK